MASFDFQTDTGCGSVRGEESNIDDQLLKRDQIPLAKDFRFERNGNDATITLENVEGNQAWQVLLTK